MGGGQAASLGRSAALPPRLTAYAHGARFSTDDVGGEAVTDRPLLTGGGLVHVYGRRLEGAGTRPVSPRRASAAATVGDSRLVANDPLYAMVCGRRLMNEVVGGGGGLLDHA